MVSIDDIKAYHCPRWEELPDLDLYMDQVMSVLEKNLCIFIEGDPAKAITPTMINNYVKQKMVRPPKNKKYDRGHIASFFIITLLKQIMSLSEIKDAIDRVLTHYTPEEGYNRFCEIFENTLHAVFFDRKEEKPMTPDKDRDTASIILSITLAYSNMFYARYLLGKTAEKKPEKQKPQKGRAEKDKEKKKKQEQPQERKSEK